MSVDPNKEDELKSGLTFTSLGDPTVNTGVYKNETEFTMAVLNGEDPSMLVYGGNYVSSGIELLLEIVFSMQFLFGIGGPKMKRPTQISQLASLQHYMRLSLPQFMRGYFLLVVLYMFNRIKSYKSVIITRRSTRIHCKPFTEVVSTLTGEQINAASEKKTKGIVDSSIAGEFLSKVETSCGAIGYT